MNEISDDDNVEDNDVEVSEDDESDWEGYVLEVCECIKELQRTCKIFEEHETTIKEKAEFYHKQFKQLKSYQHDLKQYIELLPNKEKQKYLAYLLFE